MSKVTNLPLSNSYNTEQALDRAKAMGFSYALIIGYDEHGVMMAISSKMTKAEALWLIENYRQWILNG